MAKKIFKSRKSIKIFLGTMIPMIVVSIISCTVYYMVSMGIINDYVDVQTQKLVEEGSSQVSEVFSFAASKVDCFADFATDNHSPEALKPLAKSFDGCSDYIDSIYYSTLISRFEEGGFYLDSSDWEFTEEGLEYDPTEEDYFYTILDGKGEMVYTPPEMDYTDVTPIISVTFGKAVLNRYRNPIGVVLCDIDATDLSEFASTIKASESGACYVLAADGAYMTNPDAEKIINNNYFEDNGFTEEEFEEITSKDAHTEIRDGRYYAFAKISGTPYFMVTDGNIADFNASFKQLIVYISIGLFILNIICAIYVLLLVKSLQKKSNDLGFKLFEETQNLAVSTKETAATSQDQSAAVKEILATMEDSNQLSENISSKITDVTSIASKTSTDVAEGVDYIQKNVEQLHAIFDANQQTINGMKELDERIESIWDIVTLINSVADQAKIIAFNAELEATSAGTSGHNFQIVANEIRRLADGIIGGTKEIKEKITEIQHSSDSLILASESGTKKIDEGYESAKDLEAKFNSIKMASEITATSANDIKDIIQQQTIASEQILIALKQIASGVESFTVATDNISGSAENLKQIADELNNQVKDFQ